ncbi:MAG TPA: dihydrofolate reductase family protein [Nitrososphaerales archaeon]|nr:dihydrofolate reductase family protein [Nitrososphaerales archaeon]
MRKLVVLTFLTLDGVMQAPGGPEEDPSGGFTHGGWSAPYWDDFMGNVMTEQMKWPFDLLLGRKTYEIFAGYWPKAEGPGAKELNDATKFVVSTMLKKLDWAKSVLISGDVVNQIRNVKKQSGPELQVHGSGNLIQTLLKNDLVDEFRLKTFPLTLGGGKRLFAEGSVPAGFKLIGSKASPKGVIVATYERAGDVKTGSLAEGPPSQG